MDAALEAAFSRVFARIDALEGSMNGRLDALTGQVQDVAGLVGRLGEESSRRTRTIALMAEAEGQLALQFREVIADQVRAQERTERVVARVRALQAEIAALRSER
jgi:hypothetical protein